MLLVPRAPRDDNELWWLIVALFGVRIPRIKVCPDHCSPFEAVAHAYFAREPNFAVWYGSRGSGKSYALAILGLIKTFVTETDVTILGGSMTQSLNVRQHMRDIMERPNAPRYVMSKNTATLIQTWAGAKIKPLPASQTTVRGPHPPLQLLDEVDEMDYDIYQAALGQAMEQESKVHVGENVAEYIVASSTWQNPEGTFSKVVDDAREKGKPIFTWCWRELLQTATPDLDGTWMTQRFIDNKRNTVSAQMWATEYELGEPSASSRALDLDKVTEFFVPYGQPLQAESYQKTDDELWVWEKPQSNGLYAVGADWAKQKDKTVITVERYDTNPIRVVKARIVNRRPWDVMINWFNEDIKAYQAVGQHDKTGLGGVIHDFIDDEDSTGGFVFVGRARTGLLLDYITEFEHGRYRMPQELASYYRAHRSVTVADVYAPSKWDSHLPDEFASCALVNRAVKQMPMPVGEMVRADVKRSERPRKVDMQFHVKPEVTGIDDTEMVVRALDEPSEFSLLV